MANPNNTTPAPAPKVAPPNQEMHPGGQASAALKRKERDALFEAAAKGMTPVHRRKGDDDPLQTWAPQILRKHKQGFSVRQIATMTRAPGIGLKVSVRAIQRLIAEHAKKKQRASGGSGSHP